MPRQKLLSFYSPMRGGKDTAAKYAMTKIGGKCVKLAYGDELKRLYHKIFGYSDDVKKDREGYQWFGQVMRERNPRIWIEKVDPFLQYHKAKYHHVIFTDMRQPNEYEHLKSNGFVMIKIECPEEIRIQRMIEAGEEVREDLLHHETESHIDSFEYDYLIKNDGTLEDLYRQIDEILYNEEVQAYA